MKAKYQNYVVDDGIVDSSVKKEKHKELGQEFA